MVQNITLEKARSLLPPRSDFPTTEHPGVFYSLLMIPVHSCTKWLIPLTPQRLLAFILYCGKSVFADATAAEP